MINQLPPYVQSFYQRNDIKRQDWEKRIETCLLPQYRDLRILTLLKELSETRITKLRQARVSEAPAVYLVVKNDIERMRIFLDYYRRIGIKEFVVLDNNSDDGTSELLQEQDDVTLYWSDEVYTSLRRIIWLDLMLAENGLNKWCLVVDSDEFFTYENQKHKDIREFIAEVGGDTIGAMMVDMYPKGKLFCGNGENFMEDCRFCDKGPYWEEPGPYGAMIRGGPRLRVFNCNVCLLKRPLFYYGDDIFYAHSHYVLPVREVKVSAYLRHYKFVSEKDWSKVESAVKMRNYANGSSEYRRYKKGVSFYDEVISKEWDGCIHLNCIQI